MHCSVFGDLMLERLAGTRVRAVLRKARRIYWRTRMEQEVEALAFAGAEARVLRKAELRHKLRIYASSRLIILAM